MFGNAWNDRLDWIAGYYFNRDAPNGQNGTQFTAFSIGAVPSPPVSGLNTFYNWAVFGQTGLDISEWTIDGLKLNLGARYATDKARACAASGVDILTQGECEDKVALAAAPGSTLIGPGATAIHEENYSYTVGVDWQINPDTLVYVTHRRGYRSGSINTPMFNTYYTTGGNGPSDPSLGPLVLTNPGQGCAGTPQTATTGCPDLRPFQTTDAETIKDVEIGVKNDWNIGGVKGRVNAAAFYMKYDNAVAFLGTSAARIPGAYQPNSSAVGYNAADMTIKGLEFDVTVIPVPSLTLTVSGAFTDQDIDTVKTTATPIGVSPADASGIPQMAPDFSGTFSFNWMLPVKPLDGDIGFSGDYYYIGDFSGQGGTTDQLPGYHLINFRLAWTGIAKSGLDLAAYVKNATDEEYFSSPTVIIPSSFPMSVAMPGDPRTWGVEATYKF